MRKFRSSLFPFIVVSVLSIAVVAFAAIDALYDTLPDVGTCDPGGLKDSEKQKALDILNEIRDLHGLEAVTYEDADDKYTEASALITAANGQLSHTPDNSWTCYTADGEEGSSKSNLYLSSCGSTCSSTPDTDDIIIAFLIDLGVDSLGHRRWVLDPFLSTTSYGRVDGEDWAGASLKVVNDTDADISNTNIEFVAYPYGSYPAAYFDTSFFLSFTVVHDLTSKWNNDDVDFSNADISVSDNRTRAELTVTDVSSNNTGYGVPNCLQWKVDNLQEQTTYTVTISNVNVGGAQRSYSYTFNLGGQVPDDGNNDSGGDDGESSSGGCSMVVAQGNGVAWLLLVFGPLVALVVRRRR